MHPDCYVSGNYCKGGECYSADEMYTHREYASMFGGSWKQCDLPEGNLPSLKYQLVSIFMMMTRRFDLLNQNFKSNESLCEGQPIRDGDSNMCTYVEQNRT